MGNLLHTEWYKLSRDKNFWIIAIVILLFNMIVFSGSSVLNLSGQSALIESMKKEIITEIMACIYGGVSLGGDFSDRTLYHGLLTGKSRNSVLIAKTVVFTTATNILLFIFPLLLVLTCSTKNGWGTAISAGYLLHMVSIVISMLILGCAISALSLLSAVCFRDIGRTIGVPIVLYFVMIFLLNSSYASTLMKIFPIGLLILTVSGTVSPAHGMLLGALWFAFLSTTSILVFRRADLR